MDMNTKVEVSNEWKYEDVVRLIVATSKAVRNWNNGDI